MGRTYDDLTQEMMGSLPAEQQRNVAAGFADFTESMRSYIEAKQRQNGEGYEVTPEDIREAMAMINTKKRKMMG